MSSPPLLAVEGIRFGFGAVMAVDGVDLAVTPGSIHALIGPNGAGKTTLLNLLSGELRPRAGTVRFKTRDITRLGPDDRARLGIGRSFQRVSLFPDLTVFANCCLGVLARRPWHRDLLWRSINSDEIRVRTHAALVACGLAAQGEAPVGELSHGERRQLELALVLAAEPELLLLDEPMAGLDGAETGRMVALLRRLAGRRAIVLVEHDMDTVFALADTVTVMVAGQILASGAASEVRRDQAVRVAYLEGCPSS